MVQLQLLSVALVVILEAKELLHLRGYHRHF